MNNNIVNRGLKTCDLYLNYGIRNGTNADRLGKVLSGDLKCLFGIEGNLHIYGNRHTVLSTTLKVRGIMKSIISDGGLNDNHISQIKSLMKNENVKTDLFYIKKDIKYIKNILESKKIDKIGVEASQSSVDANLESTFDIIGMFGSSIEPQYIKDFLLLMMGPVFFTYFDGSFDNLEIFGIEGQTYNEGKTGIEKNVQNFEKAESREEYLSYGNSISNKIDSSMDQRNVDIVDKIKTYAGSNVLVVVGKYHENNLKKLMPKTWKVSSDRSKLNIAEKIKYGIKNSIYSYEN